MIMMKHISQTGRDYGRGDAIGCLQPSTVAVDDRGTVEGRFFT